MARDAELTGTQAGPGAGTAAASQPAGKPMACPSGPCQEGALLIGVMGPDGRLAYLQPPTHVDAEFVAGVRAAGHPQRTYRFSTPCVEGACPQWAGDSCGLGHLVAEQADELDAPASGKLPACAIRSGCRWYAEQGATACAVCPLIVADTGGTRTYSEPQGGPLAAVKSLAVRLK
jgi:hypothetical protein